MALFNLTDVNTLEDLKKQYYRLAKIYHPDAGGTNEQMKALNAEYELLFDKLSRGGNLTDDEINLEYQINEIYKEIIDKIIQYPGLEIEIIGTWIWVSGNTFPIKDILKEIGFKFAPKKKRWYWHTGEYRKKSKADLSIEEIRNLYGSQKVDSKGQKAISGLASLAGNLKGLQHLLNHKTKISGAGIGAISNYKTFKGYRNNWPEIGDYISLKIKRGGVTSGTQGFVYEVSENGKALKLMDDFGNKSERLYFITYFDKAKIKRIKTPLEKVSGIGAIENNTADKIGLGIIAASIITLFIKNQ